MNIDPSNYDVDAYESRVDEPLQLLLTCRRCHWTEALRSPASLATLQVAAEFHERGSHPPSDPA